MTSTTNARIAGFTFLFYIAAGIGGLVLFSQATSGAGTAARLAAIAQHTTVVRITVLLGFLQNMSALVLAVTLYGITRDQDNEIAVLALACRVGEGLLGATHMPATLTLVWLATATGPTAPDATTVQTLGTYLLRGNSAVGATFFAVGSTLFAWLLLRGRMIPVPLAWLGVLGSALLVIGLPLQVAGFMSGSVTSLMWIPVAAFELTVAPWLLIKGVATPATQRGRAGAAA